MFQSVPSVSYTHLDVYKRQGVQSIKIYMRATPVIEWLMRLFVYSFFLILSNMLILQHPHPAPVSTMECNHLYFIDCQAHLCLSEAIHNQLSFLQELWHLESTRQVYITHFVFIPIIVILLREITGSKFPLLHIWYIATLKWVTVTQSISKRRTNNNLYRVPSQCH